MSRMGELAQAIETLIAVGNTLVETGEELRKYFTETAEAPQTLESAPAQEHLNKVETPLNPPEESAQETPAAPVYTKERVRGILARKSREDREAVKALVQKYGHGGSLTDVDEKDYAALVAEAEAIGHAG